ncbi:MAG: nucleotide exchange factor GrpE, partial [Candidatus Acidiferrales bacterium]
DAKDSADFVTLDGDSVDSAATLADASASVDYRGLSDQERRLIAEMEELKGTLIRRQADFENYRKRIERERQQDRHRGIEAIVEALLPVMDGFERALAAHGDPSYEEHRKGFELIARQLQDVLAKRGLEKIEAEGKPFDPHMHHAVERVERDDVPDGTVLGVLQTGYRFHDRVLRPAMVRVAAHSAAKSAN